MNLRVSPRRDSARHAARVKSSILAGVKPEVRRKSLAKLLALSIPTAMPTASMARAESQRSLLAFSERRDEVDLEARMITY